MGNPQGENGKLVLVTGEMLFDQGGDGIKELGGGMLRRQSPFAGAAGLDGECLLRQHNGFRRGLLFETG